MKKKIMIDMDDVLIDQTCWLNPVNKFLNTNYKIDDVKGYYIQDLIPKERLSEYTKYFKMQNIYDKAVMQKNCVKVIKELSEKYDIYICTAYIYRDDASFSSSLLKYKFDFLYKNFPFLNPSHFIFCDDKSILNFDIKIDDKIDNLSRADIKLMYTAYHNKNISEEYLNENNIIRVNNWIDIKNILLEEK